MTSANSLTLAVAGGRKTQGIVDACAEAPNGKRILIITYTQANQDQLRVRLNERLGMEAQVEVMGWFSFLISHVVRPFLPFVYEGRRVRGFDFDSPYQRGVSAVAYQTYFNSSGQVRKVHLAHLAHQVFKAGDNEAMDRLARLYDRIYIDEIQDLCGWDLEVLELLLKGRVSIEMVGDVRQAILSTSFEERKNARYERMKIWQWFQLQNQQGRLSIEQRPETWRCHQDIAAFADGLFAKTWGFEATVSLNEVNTAHDGVFLVREADVSAYIEEFTPLFLRDSANTARGKNFQFMNIGVSKGLSSRHVLIWPTGPVKAYLATGKKLDDSQASKLYVAVTRAEQSVAFVFDAPGSSITRWSP